MHIESDKHNIVYHDSAPYEVLSTMDLSYDEILQLKGICDMVEVYYNSAQFTYSIQYLEHFYTSPMKLYRALSDYYELNGWASIAHSRIRRFEILLAFFQEIVLDGKEDCSEEVALFTEILVFDVFIREGST